METSREKEVISSMNLDNWTDILFNLSVDDMINVYMSGTIFIGQF
jgi:hypothetical protein